MMRKMGASGLDKSSDEESIISYLNAHRDFFARHPEVLARLSIPHDESGSTISLIERQVGVLRDENSRLRRKFHDLLATARANETLGERVHPACAAFTAVRSMDDFWDGLSARLGQFFDVAYVDLKIARAGAGPEGPGWVDADEPRYRRLYDRVAHGKSACDDRLAKDLLEFLFLKNAPRVGSCALVPVGGRKPTGILALGAEEADRFRADLGTLYLDRLGEILGATLARLL